MQLHCAIKYSFDRESLSEVFTFTFNFSQTIVFEEQALEACVLLQTLDLAQPLRKSSTITVGLCLFMKREVYFKDIWAGLG